MNTGLPLLGIGLVFGAGIGFTLAAANGITLDGHDHSVDAGHSNTLSAALENPTLPEGMTAADICTISDPHGGGDHDHGETLSITPSETAPTLTLAATKDPASGWNLNIQTEHFDFSPQNASRDHILGEGHAHVYINGIKLGRVYGSWIHLDNLPQGDVVVDVTLNANDHRTLAVGDQKLTARVTLQN